MEDRITFKKNKAPLGKRIGNLLVHIFLAALACLWLLPILWIILTSLRGEQAPERMIGTV